MNPVSRVWAHARSARFVVSLMACVALTIGAVGCSRAEAPASRPSATAATVEPSPAQDRPKLSGPAFITPAFITTVRLTLAVASVPDATSKLREASARFGGHVAQLSASGEGPGARHDQSASLDLRIPSERVHAFVGEVSRLGDVTSEDERVDDVSEERADRHARLANARAEEKRLLELLDKRTGTLADVLAAEKELARVRETVERYEAQAAALEGKIALATVHVSLVTSSSAKATGAGARVAQAARDGVRHASTVTVGLVALFAEAGPTLFVLLLLVGTFALVVRAAFRITRRKLVR